MTLIAGAFLLDATRTIPAHLTAALSQHVARAPNPETSVRTLSSARCFAIKVDIGAYQEPALSESPDGSFSAMMGDALICSGNARLPRARQLALLEAACDVGNDEVFAQARGTYSFVRFDASHAKLSLVSDAIGARPLYYCIQAGLLLFSSALRILESVPSIHRSICLFGLAEQAVFGYPLAERTPYNEIFLLREGDVLTCDASGVRTRSYLNWTTGSDLDGVSYDRAVDNLASCFKEAVNLRAGSDQETRAFLSGGLDSRSIVSALVERGSKVTAFNFSFARTQDHVFAKAFARDAGSSCTFHWVPRDASMTAPHWSLMMADALKDAPQQLDHPRLIWSGDGGSVGLGHVYIDEDVIELLSRDQRSQGISRFLASNKFALPLPLFNSKSRRRLSNSLSDAISKEFDRYPHADRGRQLFLFLLLNSNRRHMHRHFEDIDLHKLEFHLPFYDAALMRMVCAFPSAAGIKHRLYMDFFQRLPAFAGQSPWQTYPGHLPCPITTSTRLRRPMDDRGDRCKSPNEMDKERACAIQIELGARLS